MRYLLLILCFTPLQQLFAQTRIELNPPEDRFVEKLITFDPVKLSVKKIQSRIFLVADDRQLKDFGLDEKAANDALRVLRELKVNQYGKITDSQPPLEYWLADGQAPRKALSMSRFVAFDVNTLSVEKSFGVWMLRDYKQMIFSFGANKPAAEEAMAICRKYKFNQLGYIGTGIPSMTYFLIDPFQGVAQKSTEPSALEALQSADRLGLILPEIGLVGPRIQIDSRKIELIQERGDWQVRYGSQVFGSFSKDELVARRSLRMLQDFRVTEYVQLGKSGVSLFLSFGQPLVKVPLGFQSISFKPSDLNVKDTNGKWFVTHVGSPLLEAGDTKEEATLLMKVIQFYHYDRILVTGNPLQGGMKVLIRDR